jgi:hypothetical protein
VADTIRLTARAYDLETEEPYIIVTCENTGAMTTYRNEPSKRQVIHAHFAKGYDSQHWLLRVVGSGPQWLRAEVHNIADLREALAAVGRLGVVS